MNRELYEVTVRILFDGDQAGDVIEPFVTVAEVKKDCFLFDPTPAPEGFEAAFDRDDTTVQIQRTATPPIRTGEIGRPARGLDAATGEWHWLIWTGEKFTPGPLTTDPRAATVEWFRTV